MATYVGFYTIDPSYAALGAENARSGGGPDIAFLDKVRALGSTLPEGTRIIGSYMTMSSEKPNVLIVETDDPSALAAISQYYTGYLAYDWTPANVIGASEGEREQWRKSAG